MTRRNRAQRGFRPPPRDEENEPRPDPDDIVDWGGEPIVAVDFTDGGAPYGATVRAWRESSAHEARDAAWARAKYWLARAITEVSGDVTTTTFSDVDAARRYSPAELTRLFSLR